MKVLYKVYFLIFCQIVAPALVVGGFIINAVILDVSALPVGFKEDMNWFQENPELSDKIVLGSFITAGILAVSAIITAFSIAQSKKGGEDTGIGLQFKRDKSAFE